MTKANDSVPGRKNVEAARTEQETLWALTPLDGRYRAQLSGLEEFVSEAALIRYRVAVEAAWLAHLGAQPIVRSDMCEAPDEVLTRTGLNKAATELKRGVEHWADGDIDVAAVKTLERTTNHDVKAVEYWLKARLESVGAKARLTSFLHFACTSEDINNLAYALMMRDVRSARLMPRLRRLARLLGQLAQDHADLPMLARTHGQAATPTTLGKEFAVFGARLLSLSDQLAAVDIRGKLNGAVGNYNAHLVAYPELDWPAIGKSFVEERLGLSFNAWTTQIENHDWTAQFASALAQVSTLLIGLCRDMWSYISLGYLQQRTVAGEVGSSTMPHKVNPIDFENAEGNFGLAIATARHLADKLPISRWQRDLSDSTAQRALGGMIGHFELALAALSRGLGKVSAAPQVMAEDLDEAWEVLGEAIQTLMRRRGVGDAYERLKDATRGKAHISREALLSVIDDCAELTTEDRQRLQSLAPARYIGLASELAHRFAQELMQRALKEGWAP